MATTRRRGVLVSAALILAFVGTCPFSGLSSQQDQPSSGFSGSVQDSTGALIPGASVTVKDQATGETRSATTDDAGSFRISGLVPGKYTVTVEKSGFAESIRSDVPVSIGNESQLNFVLVVGSNPLGEIRIFVKDTNGTPISGALITITATPSNTVWHGTSGSNGEYLLPNIPCVDYTISIDKTGTISAMKHVRVRRGTAKPLQGDFGAILGTDSSTAIRNGIKFPS